MTPDLPASFKDASEIVRTLRPALPVYCIYPQAYRAAVEEFKAGFPGRTMYAIKANNAPQVLAMLGEFGIRDFDCASVDEIRLAHEACPDATCYFMNPVRLDNAARVAATEFGTRHFVVDHIDAIPRLASEIDPGRCVIFARMAVHHASAMEDLSQKFGARPAEIPALLEAIAATGAEAALAFNVGSGVTSPDGYRHAMQVARDALQASRVTVRLVDVGGGFPRSYPGFDVPPLAEFFDAIRDQAVSLPLHDDGELLAEPGRALAAPGLSVIVKVLLKKPDRLYLNDGMYGSFWELRFKGHKRYPFRVYRNGEILAGRTREYRMFGPTCDSSDVLPEPLAIPADVEVGDYIEFGSIGAYSVSGRTGFNGFHAGDMFVIDDPDASPPD
ncbi:MAG: hypothetical protein R3288_11740 [Woeseiaceae bacterium]|nr:hypothetical protein [Woeseiaceae bacterium]